MTQFIFYTIFASALVTWFITAGKNKSRWGINLKRVYCPVCQTKQPFVRIPKTGTQMLWGGTTCPRCHANLDKYGNVIP